MRDLEQTPAEVGAFQPGEKPGKALLARGLQREPKAGAATSTWGQCQLSFSCSQPGAGTAWCHLDTEDIKNSSAAQRGVQRAVRGLQEGPSDLAESPCHPWLCPSPAESLGRHHHLHRCPSRAASTPSSVHTSGAPAGTRPRVQPPWPGCLPWTAMWSCELEVSMELCRDWAAWLAWPDRASSTALTCWGRGVAACAWAASSALSSSSLRSWGMMSSRNCGDTALASCLWHRLVQAPGDRTEGQVWEGG